MKFMSTLTGQEVKRSQISTKGRAGVKVVQTFDIYYPRDCEPQEWGSGLLRIGSLTTFHNQSLVYWQNRV